MTLEVVVPKSQGINSYFKVLSDHNIVVQSMRNKTNRLEQLFLEMTNEPVVTDAPRSSE
jgi:ABC-2 type transport system ATP-binding protein